MKCLVACLVDCKVFSHRRKASKSSSNGAVSETTTKKRKRDKHQPAIYEMACEVNGAANSLDKNGRLVSSEQAKSTPEDDNDVLPTYANALYANASMPASAPPVSSSPSQAASSRAADEDIHTSINDITLIDNAIYDG